MNRLFSPEGEFRAGQFLLGISFLANAYFGYKDAPENPIASIGRFGVDSFIILFLAATDIASRDPDQLPEDRKTYQIFGAAISILSLLFISESLVYSDPRDTTIGITLLGAGLTLLGLNRLGAKSE